MGPQTGRSGQETASRQTTTTAQQTSPVSRQELDEQIRQWMATFGSSAIARETRVYSQKERRQSVLAFGELNILLGAPFRLIGPSTDLPGTDPVEQYRGAFTAFANKCVSGPTEVEVRKGELIEQLHHTSLFATVPIGIGMIDPTVTPQLNMSFGQIRPRTEQNCRPGLFYSTTGVSFTASSGKSRSQTGRQRVEQIEESGRTAFDALETTALIAHLKALGREPSNESEETTFIAGGSVIGTSYSWPTFRGQDQESAQIDDPSDSSEVIASYGASTPSY